MKYTLYLWDGKDKVTTTYNVPDWLKSRNKNTTLKYTNVGGVRITTGFLGLNYGDGLSEKALIWETLVVGGNYNLSSRRYATIAEARAGHEKAVKMVEDDQGA